MSRDADQPLRKSKVLTEGLDSVLRETLFDNRYVLHPLQLSEIGSTLSQSFERYVAAPDDSGALELGAHLATKGLGEKTVLRLASELSAFGRLAPERVSGGTDELPDRTERYRTLLMEGFIATRENQILTDQEQLRRALSAALASQSEELLVKNHAINTSINGIMLSDLEGKVTWVNSSFLRMWGFEKPEESQGVAIGDFWEGDQGGQIAESVVKTGGWHGRLTAKRKDGGTFSAEVSASLIKNEQGHAIGMMASAVDITEHLKAEEMAKNLLMVKEIHHRIKNNLQVISSLLYLQSGYVQDPRTREMFKESQDRVRSMALLHEKLYQSKSLAGVEFSAYVRDLTRNLFQSYGVNSGAAELELQVTDVTLGMDTAVPCGLIINELVSNSLKHAFPPRRAGQGQHLPQARPRGEGRRGSSPGGEVVYPQRSRTKAEGFPDGIDFRNTDSLGLKLVCTLTEQLFGTIDLNRDGGTEFTIRFREL